MSHAGSSCIELPVKNSEQQPCPYPEAELFDYFLDLAEGHDDSRVRRHVFACAHCRERLRAFQESERTIRRRPAERKSELTAGPLGELTLIEILGQGGMGKVWKAYDPHLQRFLAVKVMHTDLLEQSDLCERFVHEARVTARLNHPNIVQIFAIGKQGRSVFIAMELIDGRSLKDVIRARALNVGEIVNVLRQMLCGVAAAHRERIVHRDMKPSNVMLDRQGRVRILDFGLAKELRSTDNPQTLPGALVGTLAYMPPEALAGGAVSRQWDVYSIGVVAYELLTGVAPFSGMNPLETLQAMKSHAVLRPSESNPLVPAWLDEIVMKMCATPRERYANAEAVLEALDVHTHAPAPVLRAPLLDDTDIELETIEDVVAPTVAINAPAPVAVEELLLQDAAVQPCVQPLLVRRVGIWQRFAEWLS